MSETINTAGKFYLTHFGKYSCATYTAATIGNIIKKSNRKKEEAYAAGSTESRPEYIRSEIMSQGGSLEDVTTEGTGQISQDRKHDTGIPELRPLDSARSELKRRKKLSSFDEELIATAIIVLFFLLVWYLFARAYPQSNPFPFP